MTRFCRPALTWSLPLLPPASDSFILNPEFETLLSREQTRIKAALDPLMELANDPAIQNNPSFSVIKALLEAYGKPDDKVVLADRAHAPPGVLHRENTRMLHAQGDVSASEDAQQEQLLEQQQ